jgi:hypothetical protein
MAEKLYELYGIPANPFPEYDPIPGYAFTIELGEEDENFFSHKLFPHAIRLWGQATYWTALEASLLIAGIDPNDDELYAVSSESVVDDDFNDKRYFTFKYSYEFCNASDYLFLFERSALAPKSTPIEWVKFFNLKVRNAFLKHPFEPAYCEEWQEFFKKDLSESELTHAPTTEKSESLNANELGRRDQQHEIILAIIHALNFEPLHIPDGGKAKIKAICLKSPKSFTYASFDHAWKAGLEKNLFKLENADKFKP